MSVDLLEAHDNFARVRNALRQIGQERGHWAGIPMPLGEDSPLVVEPKYPNAAGLMAIGRKAEDDSAAEEHSIRNRFWSWRRRCDIVVWNEGDRIEWGLSMPKRIDMELSTLGASYAWGFEQEVNAVQLLATLVRHHTFKMYMLTGMFLERSERSGVMYLFRRLRPTVALREERGRMRILCALCLHPIAYYSGSWAGAMCPTDDVVAHLMLMRGDEAMFWRRANQHPAWRPESGL
jgi:hypothetical protein